MPLNYLTFPNEIIENNNTILYKPGQLTDNGIITEYMIGKKIASKYNFLITQNFSTEENVYATSGVDKRVVESLLSILAGMFPPSKNETLYNTLYKTLNWKPIAITTNEIYDQCGTGIIKSCPFLYNTLIKTPEFKKINLSFSENKKLFSQLTTINIDTLYDLDIVIDNLQTRYILNNSLKIPPWANTNSFKKKVIEIHNNIQSSFSKLFVNKIGGWHHQTIIKEIRNFITNQTANKINLYGVHDINLMLLSQLYGIPHLNDTLLPFSSYIIFEVHFINNSYYIKAEYGNGSNLSSIETPITFFNCTKYCLLSNFESLGPIVTTEEWNIKCKGPTKLDENYIGYFTISGLLNFFLIFILTFSIINLLYYKKLYKKLIVNEETPLIVRNE